MYFIHQLAAFILLSFHKSERTPFEIHESEPRKSNTLIYRTQNEKGHHILHEKAKARLIFLVVLSSDGVEHGRVIK